MDPFCYLFSVSVMLSCLLIVALWSPAGKGLVSCLFCIKNFDVFLCFAAYPYGVLCQVWYLIASK